MRVKPSGLGSCHQDSNSLRNFLAAIGQTAYAVVDVEICWLLGGEITEVATATHNLDDRLKRTNIPRVPIIIVRFCYLL